MSILQYKYSRHTFINCLKSLKIQCSKAFLIFFFKKQNIIKNTTFFISTSTIIYVNKIAIEEKNRIQYIITNYSVYQKIKYNVLTHKYIDKFIYEYIKYHKYFLSKFINLNMTEWKSIKVIALVYVYTIYKLVNTKNPFFIFFHLIK